MDIRQVIKVFVLFLDGMLGIAVILIIMIPLWLVNIITAWTVRVLVKAQTKQLLNEHYPQKHVDRAYKVHMYVRWVRRQLATAYYYGIEHLKPLEERKKYHEED